MDKSLSILCSTIKRICSEHFSNNAPLSLTLLTGKTKHGKSALLHQSKLEHIAIESELETEIYFNSQGIIIELGENWLNQSNNLLQNTFKEINRAHRGLKISGILLCIDIQELCKTNPDKHKDTIYLHNKLLSRFGANIGYRVDIGFIIAKSDTLAGFCEFYQNAHISDLKQALGFSLPYAMERKTIHKVFKLQFEQFVDMLSQQVLHKIHPARSSIKRTLIREFPLQILSLESSLFALINSINFQQFRLQALYFTSAKQGGESCDQLEEKINHEYSLSTYHSLPLSQNYKSFFVEGALHTFMKQTQIPPIPNEQWKKWLFAASSCTLGLGLIWIGYNVIHSTKLINEASKELQLYEISSQDETLQSTAGFHLLKASDALEGLSINSLSLPSLHRLKKTLHNSNQNKISGEYIPQLLAEIEQALIHTQSPAERYEALRIYLMLGTPKYTQENDVILWFKKYWAKIPLNQQAKKISLLKKVLKQPFQALPIKQSLVDDVRTYLNALPTNYLYYSIAKPKFPTNFSAVDYKGFQLATNKIPIAFTKAGFHSIIEQIPTISQTLEKNNWVLMHPNSPNILESIQQAYCYDYVTWWKQFLQKTFPLRAQNTQEAHLLLKTLIDSQALVELASFAQQQTSPDFGRHASLFNQRIASEFSPFNLLGANALVDLNNIIKELELLFHNLSVVSDNGKASFLITKSRFKGDTFSNPLSSLYKKSEHLPEPLAQWASRLADNLWFILIEETKEYINHEWKLAILSTYDHEIANRFPFNPQTNSEVNLTEFDRFFSPRGTLKRFLTEYVHPFLDTSSAQWKPKTVNNYILPISQTTLDDLIRANIITSMFFQAPKNNSEFEFTLQKVSLDPIISQLELSIGNTQLIDSPLTESYTKVYWPSPDAKLSILSNSGEQFSIEETGDWALFRLLQKVNILPEASDQTRLQIVFNINGKTGRYVLATKNPLNPLIPGVLTGFKLPRTVI